MPIKLSAASVVLVVGIALASLFRKEESSAPAPPSSTLGVALRRAAPEAAEAGPAADRPVFSSQLLNSTSAAAPRPTVPLAAERPTEAPPRDPPPMPAEYAGLAAVPLRPIAAERDNRRRDSDEGIRGRGAPREVVHRVVDGDTLAGLAARYLGDAGLAERIRDANPGEVSDPLPIGIELHIPPRAQLAESRDSRRPQPLGAETRLVPMEPARVIADAQSR